MKQRIIRLSSLEAQPGRILTQNQFGQAQEVIISPEMFLVCDDQRLQALSELLNYPRLQLVDIAPEQVQILSQYFQVEIIVTQKANRLSCTQKVQLLFNGCLIDVGIERFQCKRSDIIGFRYNNVFYRFSECDGDIFHDGCIWRCTKGPIRLQAIRSSALSLAQDHGVDVLRGMQVQPQKQSSAHADVISASFAAGLFPIDVFKRAKASRVAEFDFVVAGQQKRLVLLLDVLLPSSQRCYAALMDWSFVACTFATGRCVSNLLEEQRVRAVELGFLLDFGHFQSGEWTAHIHQAATARLGDCTTTHPEFIKRLFQRLLQVFAADIAFSSLSTSDVCVDRAGNLFFNQFALRPGTVDQTLAFLADVAVETLHFDQKLLKLLRILPHDIFMARTLIQQLLTTKINAQSLLASPIFYSSFQKALFIELAQKTVPEKAFEQHIKNAGYETNSRIFALADRLTVLGETRAYELQPGAHFGNIIRFFRNAVAHFSGSINIQSNDEVCCLGDVGQLYEYFERAFPGFFQMCWETFQSVQFDKQ